MKKFVVMVSLLLGVGLLGFYGLELFNGTSYKEENGTNTNAASNQLDEFYQELKEYYPDLYEKVPSEESQTYIVPGLVQTNTIQAKGEDKGTVDQAEDMTPQGLSFVEDYVLISAYSNSYSHDSVLWILDRETGDYIKTIVLPTTSHVGGLAYDSQHKRLWITTTDEDKNSQISSLELSTIKKEDFSQSKKAVSFSQQYKLAKIEKASFMTYLDGHLFIGYFDKNDKGYMTLFSLDENGLLYQKSPNSDSYSPMKVIEIPQQIQGVAIVGKEIILSQSYGDKDSKLLFFAFPGIEKLEDLDQSTNLLKEVTAPPYMQQLISENHYLYLLFESSSIKYRLNPTVTSMDRVIKIKLD